MQSKVTNGDISNKEQPEEATQREGEDNPAPQPQEKPKALFKIELKKVKPI